MKLPGPRILLEQFRIVGLFTVPLISFYCYGLYFTTRESIDEVVRDGSAYKDFETLEANTQMLADRMKLYEAAARRKEEKRNLRKEIYLVVRRKMLSVCLEAKENWTILNVKEQLNGILSIPPSSQQLFKEDNGNNTLLEDTKTLVECGFNVTSAKPQLPATLGLAILEGEEFEKLSVTDYSQPPELPDVMKPQTPAQAGMTAKPE